MLADNLIVLFEFLKHFQQFQHYSIILFQFQYFLEVIFILHFLKFLFFGQDLDWQGVSIMPAHCYSTRLNPRKKGTF